MGAGAVRPEAECGYPSTVGPLLSFLQSRVPSNELGDVLEKLFTLLPLRQQQTQVWAWLLACVLKRTLLSAPCAQSQHRPSSVFIPEYGSGIASPAAFSGPLSSVGVEDVDPALLSYLASMGHVAAIWSLLQRGDESIRMAALKFISRCA